LGKENFPKGCLKEKEKETQRPLRLCGEIAVLSQIYDHFTVKIQATTFGGGSLQEKLEK